MNDSNVKKGPAHYASTGQTMPDHLSPAAIFQMGEPSRQQLTAGTPNALRGATIDVHSILGYIEPNKGTGNPPDFVQLNEQTAGTGPWTTAKTVRVLKGPTDNPVLGRDHGEYPVLLLDGKTWFLCAFLPNGTTPEPPLPARIPDHDTNHLPDLSEGSPSDPLPSED